MPSFEIQKLERLQNNTVPHILRAKKSEHITPVLIEIDCLNHTHRLSTTSRKAVPFIHRFHALRKALWDA